MIVYYVHHQGLGHLTRASAVASRMNTPVTGLSSLPRPTSWAGPWVQLPLDVPDLPRDPTAGGVLHWAPLDHDGYRERMHLAAGALAGTSLFVADVSVEMALLARLCGVPTVVVAMRGDRSDRPHQLAYDSATALLAPWTAATGEAWWPDAWTRKTFFAGAFSRFDGRATLPVPGQRRGLLLLGAGGTDGKAGELLDAVSTAPGWSWQLRGPESPSPDLWADLMASDVVVCSAGQNSVAEVAAARRPAVVVAQDRPFGEQHATVAALRRCGAAVALDGWPATDRWPLLLEEAAGLGGEGWQRWSDGDGAARAARALDALAGARP